MATAALVDELTAALDDHRATSQAVAELACRIVAAMIYEAIPGAATLLVETSDQSHRYPLKPCSALDADGEVIWRPYEGINEDLDDDELEWVMDCLDEPTRDVWAPTAIEFDHHRGYGSLSLAKMAGLGVPNPLDT